MLDTCTFNENTGGVYTGTLSLLGVSRSNLTNASAQNGFKPAPSLRLSEAAVTAVDSVISGNVAGSVDATDAAVQLRDCALNDNNADSGGAVKALESWVHAVNVSFQHNWATVRGGAVYMVGGDLLVEGPFSSFTDNNAYNGGAVCVDTTKSVTVAASFVRNTAIARGGGIYANFANVRVLNGSLFADNVGETGGGAVALEGGSLYVEGEATMSRNAAPKGGGGAIYAHVSAAAALGSGF